MAASGDAEGEATRRPGPACTYENDVILYWYLMPEANEEFLRNKGGWLIGQKASPL